MINKRFLYYSTKEQFLTDSGYKVNPNQETNLDTYGEIYGNSIAYIADSKEIWTHGVFYKCNKTWTTDILQSTELAAEARKHLKVGDSYDIADNVLLGTVVCVNTNPNEVDSFWIVAWYGSLIYIQFNWNETTHTFEEASQKVVIDNDNLDSNISNTVVTSKTLTNLPAVSNTPIAASDTILNAFSKLQGQVNNKANTSAIPVAATVVPKENSIATLGNSTKYAREDHKHPNGEAFLTWGGKNMPGDYSPVDAGIHSSLGANRFAFLKSEGITLEYSRDGGTTWTAYPDSVNLIKSLFSNLSREIVVGNSSEENPPDANCQTRITITTDLAGIYTQIKKFATHVCICNSSGSWLTIEGATKGAPTTFRTFVDKQLLDGYPGWNIINYPDGITTYGNSNNHYQILRFTYGIASHTLPPSKYAKGLTIYGLCAFGGFGWICPSNMAKNGHLYSYTPDQVAIFPSAVISTKFATTGGTSSQLVTGDGTLKTISSIVPAVSTLSPKPLGTATAGTSISYSREDHVHPLQTTISGNAGTATKLSSSRTFAITGAVTGSISSDLTSGVSIATTLANIDASKITSGTISIDRLPKGALERLIVVDNQAARFALTSSVVQEGDTVKQNDTKVMYYVVDTTKLNSEAGYSIYTAGSATSVPWSGITGKPSWIGSNKPTYTYSEVGAAPTVHNQASNTINALTGYTKGSATALLTSDTLNTALGKLEAKVDSKTSNTGTVTSVAMSTPTGLTVSGSPITSRGTLSLSFSSGYSIPTTAKQTNWDAAYDWGNHANAGYLKSSGTINKAKMLLASDNRTIRASALTPGTISGYFVTKGGLTTATADSIYGDFIVANTFTDDSAGYVNGIFIPKRISLDRHPILYEATYNTTDAWVETGKFAFISDIPTKVSQLTNDSNFITSIPTATTSILGGIKIGYSTSGKNYKVQLDANGNAYVNVPWTDTNTTYTGGTNISISGSTINCTYSYSLPVATSSILGGVKVGSNITVSSGTISLNANNIANALGYSPSRVLSTAELTNNTVDAGKSYYYNKGNTGYTVSTLNGFSTTNPDAVIVSTAKITFTATNTIKMDSLSDLSGTYYIYCLSYMANNKIAINGAVYA